MEFPQAAIAILPLKPVLDVRAARCEKQQRRMKAAEALLRCGADARCCAQLYTSIPFGSLIAFFALYLGIVNNQAYSRYVRFNGQVRVPGALVPPPPLTPAACYIPQQAILLDILLIVPSLVENLFRMPSSGFGLNIYIAACAWPSPRGALRFA